MTTSQAPSQNFSYTTMPEDDRREERRPRH